jgi:tetratricopeptide (TPR) repeat protein
MNRFQKILFLLLILQCGGIVYLLISRQSPVALPPSHLEMLEEPLASEIRQLEESFQGNSSSEWTKMADVYRAFGLFPQAEYCYQQAVRMAPRDLEALYKWGLCLDLLGETRSASERYRRIIRLARESPEHAERVSYCWLKIGENRLREEDEKSAEAALRNALSLPRASLLLGRILLRQNRADEALAVLRELNERHPDLVDGNQMRAWAEAAAGNRELALYYSDKTLRSDGLISFWDPLYQEVLVKREQMGSQAWHSKSRQLAGAGDFNQAIQWARKSLEAFWTEERAQHLAKLLLQTGQTREALAAAEECIARVGASAETLDIIGVCWVKLGNDAMAAEAWERALLFEPTPDLYNKLAAMAQRAGHAERQVYYQALSQYQAGKNAWVKDELSSAREHLELAVQLYGGHSLSWFYLAETRRLQGELASARVAYERCLELDPFHGRAIQGLERIESVGTGG